MERMERRVLLAIVLSFAVLYAYQYFSGRSATPPAAETAAPVSSPEIADQAGSVETPEPAVPVALSPAEALVGDTEERDIRVETTTVVATFTNRGARLKSWRLKQYQNDRGEPLELIPASLSPTQVLPFSLRVPDATTTARLNTSLYSVTGVPSDGQVTSSSTLRFEYRDSTGLEAVKEFTLEPTSYLVKLQTAIAQSGSAINPEIQFGPGLASSETVSSSWVRKPGGLTYGTELQRHAPSDIGTQPAYEGTFRYAGIDDHYFIAVAVNPGTSKVTFENVGVPPPPGAKESTLTLVAFSVVPDPAQPATSFFVGPKDFDLLADADAQLVRAIDFGMFAFLVVPLLRSLSWINGHIGNYGFSIIVLTVLINAAMFPLRHKSVVSMRKMQEIQPEAKAIQERYSKLKATDPARQKMNQELMALYRERGVNPASGCVPMLLTLPVLLAFYALLTVSIELRGAPFIGWIRDLSHPDPYYVTPVLMGITQFWQARLTPQTGTDPAQQKMMQFMPVLFMFFFLWAPAGVVLYWFVSNVWAIGQQYLTNYIIGPPKVHSVRPAAERRVKRVGGGKTDDAVAKEK